MRHNDILVTFLDFGLVWSVHEYWVHLKSRQKVLISDRGADTLNIQMYNVSSVIAALLLSAICELY